MKSQIKIFTASWSENLKILHLFVENNGFGLTTVSKYPKPELIFEKDKIDRRTFEKDLASSVQAYLWCSNENWSVKYSCIRACKEFLKHYEKVLFLFPRLQNIQTAYFEFSDFEKEFSESYTKASAFKNIKFNLTRQMQRRYHYNPIYTYELRDWQAILATPNNNLYVLNLSNAVIEPSHPVDKFWSGKEWSPCKQHYANYEISFLNPLFLDHTILKIAKYAVETNESRPILLIKNSSIQKIKFGLLTEQFYIPNNWNNKELKISQRYDEAINSASYLPDFYKKALNTLWSIPHTWPLKLNFWGDKYAYFYSIDSIRDTLKHRNVIHIKFVQSKLTVHIQRSKNLDNGGVHIKIINFDKCNWDKDLAKLFPSILLSSSNNEIVLSYYLMRNSLLKSEDLSSKSCEFLERVIEAADLVILKWF